METVFERYARFIAAVDRLWRRLAARHAEELTCRKGCCACCTDISVLPIEWAAVRRRLCATGARPVDAPADGVCAMLVDGACVVYPARPLLCRTHGLPLAYLVETYDLAGERAGLDEPEWAVTWCDLNFVGSPPERRFKPVDVVNMEALNRRLVAMNGRFLETEEGRRYASGQRLPLGALAGGPP